MPSIEIKYAVGQELYEASQHLMTVKKVKVTAIHLLEDRELYFGSWGGSDIREIRPTKNMFLTYAEARAYLFAYEAQRFDRVSGDLARAHSAILQQLYDDVPEQEPA